MLRSIATATLLAGTLDILFAVCLTLMMGREPANMLRFVASGPFPDAAHWGAQGAVLGLFVHFALMSVMVAAFGVTARRLPTIGQHPIAAGITYGLVTYFVMNLLVVPLRFPEAFPPKPLSVVTQLFAHIVLVGIPISLLSARHLRRRLS